MKFWIAPYVLLSASPLNRQEAKSTAEGFLIKVQSKDFTAGYADCRPWEFLGDPPVEKQIQYLRDKRWTVLLRRSLFFAYIDGLAREEKRSLWDSKIRLQSHYTCVDPHELLSENKWEELHEQGYRTIKLKLGRSLVDEVRLSHRLAEKAWFRWRLDFNGAGGEEFLKKASAAFLSQVDLIEDPEPYDEERWRKLEETYSVRMAYDQPPEQNEKVRVQRTQFIKPARQNFFARMQDVVTNSLDHPLGQSFAALQAQESVRRLGKQKMVYGLKADHLFAPNDYFRRLSSASSVFQPDVNYGVGFHDLLQREKWISL